MNRITIRDLQALCDRLNRVTNSPETTWTEDSAGKYRSNRGNYHLSQAYGGVSLHRICTEGGGIDDIFSCGHVSKRELYNMIHAYLRGLEEENE